MMFTNYNNLFTNLTDEDLAGIFGGVSDNQDIVITNEDSTHGPISLRLAKKVPRKSRDHFASG